MNLSKHLKILIFDNNSGEIICGCGCGYVVEEKIAIISAQEDYHNDSKNHNLRVGLPSNNLIHDHGLSTIIGKTNLDASRNEITYDNKAMFYRLRIWDERARTVSTNNPQRRMYNGLDFVSKVCGIMGLNQNVKQQVAHFYRKMVVAELAYGKNIESFIATCCYLICKQINIPITMNDFIDKLQLKTSLFHDYVYLMTVKNDTIENTNNVSSLFISKFANKLSVKNNVLLLAIKIMSISESKGITGGKNPKAVCGAALYLACNEIYGKASSNNHNKNRFSMNEISNAVELTDVTIRNTVHAMKECLVQEGVIKQ